MSDLPSVSDLPPPTASSPSDAVPATGNADGFTVPRATSNSWASVGSLVTRVGGRLRRPRSDPGPQADEEHIAQGSPLASPVTPPPGSTPMEVDERTGSDHDGPRNLKTASSKPAASPSSGFVASIWRTVSSGTPSSPLSPPLAGGADPAAEGFYVDTGMCAACGEKKRGRCERCKRVYCSTHMRRKHQVSKDPPRMALVCEGCFAVIDGGLLQDRVDERLLRVGCFLENKLTPYLQSVEDTAAAKAIRVAHGAIYAANALPLPVGAKIKYTLKTLDLVRRYGIYALGGLVLHEDVLEAIQTMVALMGDIKDLRIPDITVGLYYLMAYKRGERGTHPLSERAEHTCSGERELSPQLLRHIIWIAPFALHVAYSDTTVEAQRLARLRGFELITSYIPDVEKRLPSFQLVASRERRTCIICVRGTDSLADLVTDLHAKPVSVSEDWDGCMAHKGMLECAQWLKREVGDVLCALQAAGYRIVVTGHSLGGAVAALLTVMLRKTIAEIECYAFGTPACVDLGLAVESEDCVISVINHDDIVPRISAEVIQNLVDSVVAIHDQWTGHAQEDLEAFKRRVFTFWAPKVRSSESANRLDVPALTDCPEAAPPGTNPDVLVSSFEEAAVVDVDVDPEPVDLEAEPDPAVCPVDVKPTSKTAVPSGSQMYVPGKIVHMYQCEGRIAASVVKPTFPALQRIDLTDQIVIEHRALSYWETLQSLSAAYGAPKEPRHWQSFGASTVCACCLAPFTWNETFSSEAQQQRSMHHCRACGVVVCSQCSPYTLPLPHLGIPLAVRVCMKCYMDPAAVYQCSPASEAPK
eukprot:NODE_238_length_2630_cov_28.724525_g216_i0.p1 GENE.NODE_238_length_2630_cov_28.724525_g216_i0~~NODE_238_length_2630_cov_28.724525_g216_i0.p1  ORF type:complete len:812 (+),score=146.62 NODE_238_length_2630_cov_28.724525_g216_i0:63-2498(+)